MSTTRMPAKERVWRWARRVVVAVLGASLLALGVMSLVGFVILRRQGDIPPMGEPLRAIGMLAAAVLVLTALWWLPRRQAMAIPDDLSPRERAELTDRFRRTLGVLIALGGVLLLLERSLHVARAREANVLRAQLAQATLQLSSEQLVTRVAGVHVLADVARTSASLHRPAHETLVLFVRERSAAHGERDTMPPLPDVVAAATAVLRRTPNDGATPLRPDFSGVNLRGIVAPGAQLDFSRLRGVQLQHADLHDARIAGKFGVELGAARLDSANLAGAQLDGARLSDGATLVGAKLQRADLDGATLQGADLRFARLDGAELQGATLTGARLDSASLRDANLFGATLRGASLVGTDFAGAVLRNADLAGTDLSAARNLTSAQLAGARIDSTTRLPAGVAPPPDGRAR